MQENSRNWGTLERFLGMGGVADPKVYTPLPDMSFHVKFGSSASKRVRIITLHYFRDFKVV